MKNLIMYHNDMDGKCAAFLVRWWLVNHEETPEEIVYEPCQYEKALNWEKILEAERIWILDFSVEPEDMTRIIHESTENIVWIDHHESAIRKYQGYRWLSRDQTERGDYEIKGTRQSGISGCELTFHLLWQNRLETPRFVRLIGDRDTWSWAFDETAPFCSGLNCYDTDPWASDWSRIWGHTQDVVEKGHVVEAYRDHFEFDTIKSLGFPVKFHDHDCFAVNGRFDATRMKKVAPEAEIWITFYYAHGKWAVRLFSDTVNVKHIAEQYEYAGRRGGGHRGAAGFPCANQPFHGPSLAGLDKAN